MESKASKGMTLIEVIISIALLGIISVSFLSAFSTYYRWVIDTKRNVTEEAFSSQNDIEEAIEELKIALVASPSPSSLPYEEMKSDITLFSSIFTQPYTSPREQTTAYKRIVNISTTHEMISWLGKTRLPEAPVPVLDIQQMVLVRNGVPSTDPIDNYEYFNIPNLTLKATNTLTENPENSFYRVKHEWYISNPGYLIPIVSSAVDTNYDMGRIYPRFPQEYEAIPVRSDPVINLTSSLTDSLANSFINPYPGRHIVYVSTPYSKAFKKGVPQISFPVFISGPSVTDGLELHLDASLINKSDVDVVELVSGSGLTVKRWDNTFPSTASNNLYDAIPAIPANSADRPVLVHTVVGGSPRPEVSFQEDLSNYWGRALGNGTSGTVAKLTISDIHTEIDSSSATSDRVDLLLVMKRVANPSAPDSTGDPIIKSGDGLDPTGYGWSLSWDEIDNSKLKLGAADSTTPCVTDFSFVEDEWYLVAITAESDDDPLTTTGKIYYDVYNMKSGNTSNGHIAEDSEMGDFTKIDSTDLEINWNGIELAEVLLYQNASVANMDIVKEFLIKKYGAELPSYTIVFDSAGGSAVSNIIQKFGSRIVDPIAPTRNGYTFKGWIPAIPDTMPAGGLTCVAQWAQNYTLSFNSNGGSIVNDFVAPAGTSVSVSDPTREGYTFGGWDPELPSFMPAEDKLYTAKWVIDNFRITFDSNGGSAVTPAYIEQEFDTEITVTPSEPTRTGYHFDGWMDPIPARMPAENKTLYAQWTPIEYTMTFERVPGEVYVEITKPYGSIVTIPTEPERTGFVFDGWDPELPDPLTMPLFGATYTAQWVMLYPPVATAVNTVDIGTRAFKILNANVGDAAQTLTVRMNNNGLYGNNWKIVVNRRTSDGNLAVNVTNEIITITLARYGTGNENARHNKSDNSLQNIAAAINAVASGRFTAVSSSVSDSDRITTSRSSSNLTGGLNTSVAVKWNKAIFSGGANGNGFSMGGVVAVSAATTGDTTTISFNNVPVLSEGREFVVQANQVLADLWNVTSNWRLVSGNWQKQ